MGQALLVELKRGQGGQNSEQQRKVHDRGRTGYGRSKDRNGEPGPGVGVTEGFLRELTPNR